MLNKHTILVFFLQSISTLLLYIFHAILSNTIGVREYGIFTYAVQLSNVLCLITTFGLPNSSLRFVSQYNELKEWGKLKGIIIFGIIFVSIFSFILSIILLAIYKGSFFSLDLNQSFLLSALFLPFISIGIWRAKTIRGLGAISKSILPEDIFRPLLSSVLILIIFYYSHLNAIKSGFLNSISYIFVTVIGLIWLKQFIPSPSLTLKAVYSPKEWLSTSSTMFTASLFQALINRMDLLILGFFSEMSTIGLYSVAFRLSLLISIILRVVDIIVSPKFSAYFSNNDFSSLKSLILQSIRFSLLIATPIFLIMFIYPVSFLSLFGKEFSEAKTIFRILLVGQYINTITGPVGYAMLMTNNHSFYAKVMGFFSLFTLILHFIFIPPFYEIGAAVATSTSVILLNFCLLFKTYKKFII